MHRTGIKGLRLLADHNTPFVWLMVAAFRVVIPPRVQTGTTIIGLLDPNFILSGEIDLTQFHLVNYTFLVVSKPMC